MEKLSSNDLPKNQKKYPYITARESEVDSIVVEELFCSTDFQNWFLSKTSLEKNSELVGAWKNIVPAYFGECDIVAEFIINNKKIALLIEDKIDAPEQPKQAERYHKTGKSLVEKREVDRYITCLLSPRDYFREDAPMEKYDYKISYEELLEWFEKQNDSKRMRVKQMVLENGIRRAKTGYVQPTDEKTDNFYKYYEKIGRENNPELGIRFTKQHASDNSWINIKPSIFPSNIKIVHKSYVGYMDLQISKIKMDEFLKNMESKISKNMTIQKTGNSFSIRILVSPLPRFTTMKSPDKYKNEIIESLGAASQLMNWYSDFKNESIFIC